jgi:hypothetical protein
LTRYISNSWLVRRVGSLALFSGALFSRSAWVSTVAIKFSIIKCKQQCQATKCIRGADAHPCWSTVIVVHYNSTLQQGHREWNPIRRCTKSSPGGTRSAWVSDTPPPVPVLVLYLLDHSAESAHRGLRKHGVGTFLCSDFSLSLKQSSSRGQPAVWVILRSRPSPHFWLT